MALQRRKILQRKIHSVILSHLFFLTLLPGCSHHKTTPPPGVDSSFGHIAIVPANFVPESNFNPLIQGNPSVNATAGAAAGAAYGGAAAFAVGTVATGGLALLAAPPMILASAIGGGVSGGVFGGMATIPEEVVSKINDSFSATGVELDLQENLAKRILNWAETNTGFQLVLLSNAGPHDAKEQTDYSDYKEQGIDTIIEQKVTKCGFWGGSGSKADIHLLIEVWIVLVETDSNSRIYEKVFTYQSVNRRYEDWLANNANVLMAEIEYALNSLAERIADELFLISDNGFYSPGIISKNCWLKPIHPGVEIDFFTHKLFEFNSLLDRERTMHFMPVDTLQPTLQWESFPQSSETATETDKTGEKISRVSYDLKILKLNDMAPLKVIYSRTGLSVPVHQVEIMLEPATKYYWTFRARYFFGEYPKVTRWARSNIPKSGVDTCYGQILSANYYRFETMEIMDEANSKM